MLHVRKGCFILTLFAALLLAQPALAKEQPITEGGTVTITGSMPVDNGTLYYFNISGTGDPLTTFTGGGEFVLSSDGTIITNGVLKITDANSNTIDMDFKSLVNPDGTLVGSFLVTGGTGIYQGVSGDGDLTGVLGNVTTFKINGTLTWN